jgi:hypothetical protein
MFATEAGKATEKRDAPGIHTRKQVVPFISMWSSQVVPQCKLWGPSSNKARPSVGYQKNTAHPGGAKERQISTTVPHAEALAGLGRADTRLGTPVAYRPNTERFS